MAETPPNASPRPAVTPWRRPNLQLSHGGQQQQWPAASTVHGSGSSSGASSGSSSGAGSHRQRRVSEVMPRDCLITPAHAARGLGMLAAVARDRGSERGVTARPEAGSRGHAPSATNAEVKFSDVGGHIRGARHGRQQRLVGGPGGDPHLGGYLGRRPEGWQRRRGAQSQPRLRYVAPSRGKLSTEEVILTSAARAHKIKTQKFGLPKFSPSQIGRKGKAQGQKAKGTEFEPRRSQNFLLKPLRPRAFSSRQGGEY